MSRSRAVLRGAALLAALSPACSVEPLAPEGQLRLFVETDATLPPAPGDAEGPQAPLFDRLRVEIFPPGSSEPCSGCTREFGVQHADVSAARASVGIVTPPGRTGYRARVRLYRSGGADVVEPRPTSTLEAVVALPAVEEEGVVDAHVVLRTEELGAAQGTLESPRTAEHGAPPGGLAGTWAASYDRDCEGTPGPLEVCVRGGAFWMGDISLGSSFGNISSERLVVISPFYLDATEVTVAELRASSISKVGAVLSRSQQPQCTYTAAPDEFDQHPVNCVTRAAAEAHCATRGARLPSEAEWEFAASARRSAHAVWGNDPAGCDEAVHARADGPAPVPTQECNALGVGAAAVGSGALDRLSLGGGEILDLAGNLTEWVLDAWAEQGEPCWSLPLSRDPICDKSPFEAFSIRGASWQHPRGQLRAALRASVDATGSPISRIIGFRCARPAGGE